MLMMTSKYVTELVGNLKMKRLIPRILLACTVFVSATVTKADEFRQNEIADSLSRRLERTVTAADSIAILNDLVDLRPKAMRDSLCRLIVHTSLTSGNAAAGLDALRNMANLHLRSDSLLDGDLEMAKKFPASEDRDETLTFIRMIRNLNNVRYCTPKEKEEMFRELLREANIGPSSNVYDNIVTLHALSLFMGAVSQGELLSKYLDQLGSLIESLRPEAYALRNCYYVQAALAYADIEEYKKSIDIDTRLLGIISAMEKGSVGARRKYRDYSGNKYVIYTRLLSNYPLLTNEEVERYYKGAMNMVQTDSLSATTNRVSMRPQIYYAMAHKNYSQAVELLKKYIDYPYNAHTRRLLLKLMIEAADATGDNESLLYASRQYNNILEEALEQRNQEKYRELQIVYDINKMKSDHARSSIEMQHKMAVVAWSAAAILLILLVVSVTLWVHSKKLARSLAGTNDALRDESENLRNSQADLVQARDEAQTANRVKSDFIRNMSGEVAVPLHTIIEYTNLIVDCSEAGMKPYLKRFANLVTVNAELLNTIVNDVLNLSEIDSNTMSINCKREVLQPLCKAAVESVRHKVQPGVDLQLAEDLPELSLRTDSRRLMQILVQLLSNASKFTAQGSIRVGYDVDEEAGIVRIYVADTGIGVSTDKADLIFERFVKLDRSSQGVGIGLPIARHIAKMLGGDVALDVNYTGGAKFVISLPLE